MPNIRNSTTYDFDKKIESHSKYHAEVGDTKQQDFYPQVKLMQWENETNFSIRFKKDIVGASHELVGDKVKWKSSDNKIEAGFYELESDDQQLEDGGFEFEVVFNEKPSSNVVEYTLEHKGLRFVYQRSLTQAELDEGQEQPNNAKESYAVFHDSKMHNEYRTGKAFHIFRPFATDSSGNTTWCDIEIQGKKLDITIPQDFLDNAVYPVVLDPTFGYTSAGAVSTGRQIDNGIGSAGTPTGDGTVSKMSCYCRTWSGKWTNIKAALWADSGGALQTNGVGTETSVPLATLSWVDAPYSTEPSVTGSTAYVAGVVIDLETSGFCRFNYDFDGPNGEQDLDVGYDSPGTFTSDSNDRKYSVYATYAAAPSGYANDVNGVLAANIGKINGVATADIAKVNGV